MLWIIYFCFFCVVYLNYYLTVGLNGTIDFFDLVFTIVALAGLFLFGIKKRFISSSFWKGYFVVYIIWDLANTFFGQKITLETLQGLLLIAPIYLGLYLYAFKFLVKIDKKNKPLST